MVRFILLTTPVSYTQVYDMWCKKECISFICIVIKGYPFFFLNPLFAFQHMGCWVCVLHSHCLEFCIYCLYSLSNVKHEVLRKLCMYSITTDSWDARAQDIETISEYLPHFSLHFCACSVRVSSEETNLLIWSFLYSPGEYRDDLWGTRPEDIITGGLELIIKSYPERPSDPDPAPSDSLQEIH